MSVSEQLSLLARTPASRSTDPDSSHDAAAENTRSGARASQQHRVLMWVRRWPGRTSREIAALANVDRYMVARRLPELEPTHIRKGDLRKCAVTHTKAVTWWPNEVEKSGTGVAT